MGQYAVAEPLLHRTIAIDKKIYGPEHPRIAADLNNLAALYNAQGCAAYFLRAPGLHTTPSGMEGAPAAVC
eukprot:9482967-Pyramimonas_sp.AAC.2